MAGGTPAQRRNESARTGAFVWGGAFLAEIRFLASAPPTRQLPLGNIFIRLPLIQAAPLAPIPSQHLSVLCFINPTVIFPLPTKGRSFKSYCRVTLATMSLMAAGRDYDHVLPERPDL